MVLHQYPDYETYRKIQIDGNKNKLHRQYLREDHIARLAPWVNETLGPVSFGVCHGTRSGKEQSWFAKHLAGEPEVIGTEISDTATQFPNTIEWDFHETNPDWTGRADFVYSNAWDHVYAPRKAFTSWLDALRPGGLMLLDHTRGHRPEHSNALDPFGVARWKLAQYLDSELGDFGKVTAQLDWRADSPNYRAVVIVFTKR